MRARAAGVCAVLIDIEGTTSSIAFVHDVLFPYARERLPRFVATHHENPGVVRWLEATARAAGIDDPRLPRVIDVLLRWIDEDRKATPLKALEGMIWKAGYESGDLRAHIYPEVPAKLRDWKSRGRKLYVYSSGSIEAQKLLFGHIQAGDLAPLIDDWFDTQVGSKRESASYMRIAETVQIAAPSILFLSDATGELEAARQAGLQTIQLCRPPTACPAGGAYPCVADFDAIEIG
jgi:enolase-phosphatase E1